MILVYNCPKEELKREVKPGLEGRSKDELQDFASKPVIFVLGVLHLPLGTKTFRNVFFASDPVFSPLRWSGQWKGDTVWPHCTRLWFHPPVSGRSTPRGGSKGHTTRPAAAGDYERGEACAWCK